MESRENPVFGRKIFFLNPSFAILHSIVERLRNDEYEVYTIEDYRDGKPILSENETAICYINIDSHMSVKEWFNYVKSFQLDLTLKGIMLGVLSKNIKPADKEQFILKLNLPAGFINLNDSPTVVYSNITRILDLNGAKGRRNYVRLDCYGVENISANCMIQSRLIDFILDDLSSVGFAARCSKGFATILKKGLGYSLTLHIGHKDYQIPAIIYAVKENENDNTYVFMFAPNTSEMIKSDIRSFVFKVLQEKMNELLSKQIKDQTDYTEEVKLPEDEKVPEEYSGFQETGELESV